MRDRDAKTIARRAQELATSGDYEGFNSMVSTLAGEFDALAVDVLKRDMELRSLVTEVCRAAWERKHAG